MNFWRSVVRGGSAPQWQQTLRRQAQSKSIVTTDIPQDSKHIHEKRTGFTRDEAAPFAYNSVYEYPSDYKPWNYNYKGDGLLIALFFAATYALFSYENNYSDKTGRSTRKVADAYYKI